MLVMGAYMQAVFALATGPLTRFALLLAAVCAIGTLALVCLRRIGRWADAQVERHVQAALATEADDWGEPTREEVEYGPAVLNGPASGTPIFDATAAHFAQQEAAGIDAEWARICDATGGAA